MIEELPAGRRRVGEAQLRQREVGSSETAFWKCAMESVIRSFSNMSRPCRYSAFASAEEVVTGIFPPPAGVGAASAAAGAGASFLAQPPTARAAATPRVREERGIGSCASSPPSQTTVSTKGGSRGCEGGPPTGRPQNFPRISAALSGASLQPDLHLHPARPTPPPNEIDRRIALPALSLRDGLLRATESARQRGLRQTCRLSGQTHEVADRLEFPSRDLPPGAKGLPFGEPPRPATDESLGEVRQDRSLGRSVPLQGFSLARFFKSARTIYIL